MFAGGVNLGLHAIIQNLQVKCSTDTKLAQATAHFLTYLLQKA